MLNAFTSTPLSISPGEGEEENAEWQGCLTPWEVVVFALQGMRVTCIYSSALMQSEIEAGKASFYSVPKVKLRIVYSLLFG